MKCTIWCVCYLHFLVKKKSTLLACSLDVSTPFCFITRILTATDTTVTESKYVILFAQTHIHHAHVPAFSYIVFTTGSSEPEHTFTGCWHPVHNYLLTLQKPALNGLHPLSYKSRPAAPLHSSSSATYLHMCQQTLRPVWLRILDLNEYFHNHTYRQPETSV